MDIDSMKDVIKTNRKKMNLTQEKLANILGVSSKVVSKWECGIRYPDTSILPTLAKALNISISELFVCMDKETSKEVQMGKFSYTSFKKRMVLYTFLLLLPSLSLFGTLVNNSTIFYILLSIGLLFSFVSIYKVISLAIILKSQIRNPRQKELFKNYLGIYLFIINIIFTILIGLSKKLFIVILFYGFIMLGLYLIIKNLSIKWSKNIFLTFVIVSVLFFVLGSIFVLTIDFLPYYLFFFISQSFNFISLFVHNTFITKEDSYEKNI